jgi:DNA polymerase-3 subunit delta
VRLTPGRVESFIARPDPKISIVLLYGPDAGLVAERGRRLAAGVVDDLADPFRVTQLDGELLKDEPRLLTEEAQALSLTGGRRLVRVRPAGDMMTAALRQLLAAGESAAFLVLEAGDLGGGSALRKLVETSPAAMALPCYRDETDALASVIRATLQEEKLEADAQSIAHLASLLGGDRAVTRQELQKLALFIGDRADRRVTGADIAAVIDDSAALAIDDAVASALLGASDLEARLLRLFAEGQRPEAVLRATAMTLMLLLRLQVAVDAGTPAAAAIDAFRPPVHFRRKPMLERALGLWRSGDIVAALGRLREAEVATRGRLPSALICRNALTRLAEPALRGARARRGGGSRPSGVR